MKETDALALEINFKDQNSKRSSRTTAKKIYLKDKKLKDLLTKKNKES
ncbi:hypothetical protein Q5M85_12445 [Paraclostridium bifermentans]|nr:hypothetical protein [Paraclostridium bifermentans]